MENYFILFFSQKNYIWHKWSESFWEIQVQDVVNLLLWSSPRQTGPGSNFKLRNKPRLLYFVMACGLWVKYLDISWIKCQLFTSLVFRNYWQIKWITWITHTTQYWVNWMKKKHLNNIQQGTVGPLIIMFWT